MSLRHLRLRLEEQLPRQVRAHRPFRNLVVKHDFHIHQAFKREVFKIAWKQPRSPLGKDSKATPGVKEARIAGPQKADVVVDSGLK